MTEEIPDLKTLKAIRKIREIIKASDLMAFFIVCSEERTHWLYEVDPSWSALSIKECDGGVVEVHIKANLRDFNTQAQHRRVVAQTIASIFGARDQTVRTHSMLQYMCDALKGHFEIDHIPGFDERHDR